MLRHRFHGGFEIFVGGIDEKPLSQNLMRRQRRELGLNGSVMFVVRTDENPVPVPATGFRWLNEQQHLTLEEVRGKPTEHSLGEEGPVLIKRLENPLVVERLHVLESREREASRDANPAGRTIVEDDAARDCREHDAGGPTRPFVWSQRDTIAYVHGHPRWCLGVLLSRNWRPYVEAQ